MRDGLLALGDILSSDLRRQASDRADYLSLPVAQGASALPKQFGKRRKPSGRQIRRSHPARDATGPLFSVDENGIDIEVFSRDESTYAQLHLKAGSAYQAASFTAGTSHLSFTPSLLQALTGIRTHRSVTLHGHSSTTGTAKTVRRTISLATRLRTSASRFDPTRRTSSPGSSRSLQRSPEFEAAQSENGTASTALRTGSGQTPRLVLEPWEQVLNASGSPYQGQVPQVVRTWGASD